MTKHLREAGHFLGYQTRCLEPSEALIIVSATQAERSPSPARCNPYETGL
jgi:hypothetical protein